MSNALAQVTDLQASLVPRARRPQLCQLRALLWKEWREQWLTLVLALSVVLCVALGVRLAKFREPMLAGGFCAIALGFVLGAAVVGTEGRAMAFLRSSPVPLHTVWLVKTLLGLAVACVVGLSTQWVFEALAGGKRLEHWPSDTSALMLCLSCFVFSQYFAWWVKSPISAMGLGLLSAGAVAGLMILNPLQHYLRGHWGAATIVVGLGVLLWLGRTRFLRGAHLDVRATWRRAVGWSLLPVVLIGLLPLGVGATVLVVDDWRLDPTDVSTLHIVDGPRLHGRLLLSANSAYLFRRYSHRYQWVGWHRILPSLLSVSLRDGGVRRLLPHGMENWRVLGPVSPDGRHVAVSLRPASKRDHFRSGGSRWGVIDAGTGAVVAELGNEFLVWSFWPSNEHMVFYAMGLGRDDRWGTWDAKSGVVRSRPNLCGQSASDARFRTSIPNPPRLVFSSRHLPEPGKPNRVWLLRAEDGAVQNVTLPEPFSFSGLSWDGRFALLRYWGQKRAERNSRAPRLFELATGKTLSLEDILNGAPEGGWRETAALFSGDRRWLFVTPDSMPRRENSEWYCVDMRTLTATRRQPPAPNGPGSLSPGSSRLAERLYMPTGVLVLSVKPRDDGFGRGRLVIAPRDAPSHCVSLREGDMVRYVKKWQLDDFRWLDEERLAVCVSTRSKAGVIVANVRTKTVHPLWPTDGLGLEWAVTPWSEWQRSSQ